MKKRTEATQTLRAGCTKADPQANKHTDRQGRLRSLARSVNIIVSGEAILSAENGGKPLGGRAQNPAGGAHSAPPDPLAGGKGVALPPPQEPHPSLSALRSWRQCTILGTPLLAARQMLTSLVQPTDR